MYVQSWAARKFIDIPINDMFISWRVWKTDNAETMEKIEDCEKRHKIREKLNQAMKSARLFGTSVMIPMTKEAPMDMPLDVDSLLEGDLASIRVFDRFDLSVTQRETDLYSDNYGKPVIYKVHPTYGPTLPIEVHHSRILRFDGITTPTDSWFYFYSEDWGVSELVPVILSITEDLSLASGIAHMSQEASIPVLGVSDLRDVISGRAGRAEATVEQIGDAVNKFKSVYRLLMLDKEREEFSRVAVQFGGLADLMTRYAERLAAAADIPMTRWYGQSPKGMNATGESDMKNYVITVEENKKNLLEGPLNLLDQIIMKDCGIAEAPEYEWQSLLELSETEKVTVSKLKVDTVSLAIQHGVVDEDEARDVLKGDELFEDLSGPAPEPEDPMMDAMGGGIFGGPPGPPGAAKPPAQKGPPAPPPKKTEK